MSVACSEPVLNNIQQEEDIEFNINIRVRAKGGSFKSGSQLMESSPEKQLQITPVSIRTPQEVSCTEAGSIEVSDCDATETDILSANNTSSSISKDNKLVINLQFNLSNSGNMKSNTLTVPVQTRSACVSDEESSEIGKIDWAHIDPSQTELRERRKRAFATRASRMMHRMSTRLGWGDSSKRAIEKDLQASHSAPTLRSSGYGLGLSLPIQDSPMQMQLEREQAEEEEDEKKRRKKRQSKAMSTALNSSNLADLMAMIQKEEEEQQQQQHEIHQNQPPLHNHRISDLRKVANPMFRPASMEHRHSATSIDVSVGSAISLPDENDFEEMTDSVSSKPGVVARDHQHMHKQDGINGINSSEVRRSVGFGSKLKNLISSWKADKQAKKDEKELQKLVNTMYNILGYLSSKPVWLEEEGLFRKNGVKNDVKALVKTIPQHQAPGINALASPSTTSARNKSDRSTNNPLTTLSTRMDVHTVLGSLKKMCMDMNADRESRGQANPYIPRLMEDSWEHWYEQLSYNKKELFETTLLLLSLIHSERQVNKMDAVAISRGAPCLSHSVLLQGCGILLEGLPDIRFSKCGTETAPGTKDMITMTFNRNQHNGKLGKQKWIDMIEKALRYKLVSETPIEEDPSVLTLVLQKDKSA